MTAQTAAISPIAQSRSATRPLLGFTTLFRKELTEWARGRGALVIGAISIAGAIFTTIIPFIAPNSPGVFLSKDPTTNVLVGWGGLSAGIIAVLAAMSLISGERDRGTLAWTLSKPVSPVSIIAAKWAAATFVFATLGVIIPLAVSSVVATLVYGSVPDLGAIALFGGLYTMLPAFYIALSVALGTFVKSTAGVAGIGFVVLFAPMIVAGVVPIFQEISPTSIGAWALAVASGQSASILTLAAWLVTMAVLAVSAKVLFDRQEF